MWLTGNKFGVGFWFILWGSPETDYNAEFYLTAHGVRNWLLNRAYSILPVARIGRAVLTPAGWEEKEVWETREGFLNATG